MTMIVRDKLYLLVNNLPANLKEDRHWSTEFIVVTPRADKCPGPFHPAGVNTPILMVRFVLFSWVSVQDTPDLEEKNLLVYLEDQKESGYSVQLNTTDDHEELYSL